MSDDDDSRRYWRERARIATADLVASKLMLRTFAHRSGETESEWWQRLAAQEDGFAMHLDENSQEEC